MLRRRGYVQVEYGVWPRTGGATQTMYQAARDGPADCCRECPFAIADVARVPLAGRRCFHVGARPTGPVLARNRLWQQPTGRPRLRPQALQLSRRPRPTLGSTGHR